jgi:NADH:ubiquinone oxidoreductase subunit D
MEFYERISGARMHAAFYRPNDLNLHAVSTFLLEDILEFNRSFLKTLNEMHNVLTYNKIWKQRLINIGTYSYETCVSYGLTGIMSRSVGIKRDLRISKLETYANYYYLNFRSYVGNNGDCYDRFLLRMSEMCESTNITTQVISKLSKYNKINMLGGSKNENKYKISNIHPHSLTNYLSKNNLNRGNISTSYTTMEHLIKHFKFWSEGFKVKSNFTYRGVESPKGEFGVTLFSDNSSKPYKCKVRSPAYHHLQLLPKIAKGHFLADLVALVGTIDIVFGEVDR